MALMKRRNDVGVPMIAFLFGMLFTYAFLTILSVPSSSSSTQSPSTSSSSFSTWTHSSKSNANTATATTTPSRLGSLSKIQADNDVDVAAAAAAARTGSDDGADGDDNLDDETLSFLCASVKTAHQQQQQDKRNDITISIKEKEDKVMIAQDVVEDKAEAAVTLTEAQNRKPVLHLLYGLSGDKEGFLTEWRVSLKSILYHAPLDANLHVHIMCDDIACQAVQKIIVDELQLVGNNNDDETKKSTFKWRNEIVIQAHPVQHLEEEWRDILRNATNCTDTIKRTTFGTFYRLYADRVILPHYENGKDERAVKRVYYLDNEIIFMTNLNELAFSKLEGDGEDGADSKAVFHMGRHHNAGFLALNLPEFHKFWSVMAPRIPKREHCNDQELLVASARRSPSMAATLPTQWDVPFCEMQPDLHKLRDYSSVGYLHFNGNRPSGITFWDDGLDRYCDHPKSSCDQSNETLQAYRESWGLADYYIRLPWEWVKSMGRNMIPPGEQGHELQFRIIERR